MSDLTWPILLTWIGALLAGAALGLFFFGGLWLTLRRLPTSSNPGLLALGSLVVRLALTTLGFIGITGDSLTRLLLAVVSFTIVRQVLIRRISPTAVARPAPGLPVERHPLS